MNFKKLKKIMKMPLYFRILAGMILGLLMGLSAFIFGKEQLIYNWIQPWGHIFIRLLQLVAIPLVFFSLL